MKNLLTIGLLLFITSCTNADRSKMSGYGDNFTIKVLSCDTIIVYHSIGKVESESKSDGYYFMDAKTNKLIEVSGNVIIEQE